MTTVTARSGWFVLYPDGCAWLAVRIADGGAVRDVVEQANAETHLAANDPLAAVCRAIGDGDTDVQMTCEQAVAVIEAVNAWAGSSWQPENVTVEELLLDAA